MDFALPEMFSKSCSQGRVKKVNKVLGFMDASGHASIGIECLPGRKINPAYDEKMSGGKLHQRDRCTRRTTMAEMGKGMVQTAA